MMEPRVPTELFRPSVNILCFDLREQNSGAAIAEAQNRKTVRPSHQRIGPATDVPLGY